MITEETPPAENECHKEQRFVESNRKTQAFYITMAVMVGLFFFGSWKGEDVQFIVTSISSLAAIYIGGVAMADSVRYYRNGSTLSDPKTQQALKDRYSNR